MKQHQEHSFFLDEADSPCVTSHGDHVTFHYNDYFPRGGECGFSLHLGPQHISAVEELLEELKAVRDNLAVKAERREESVA